MKILETVQKDLAFIGYHATVEPFNEKHMKFCFASVLGNILHLVYLIFVAETPTELMVAAFMASVAFLVLISFFSTAKKIPKIFHLIEDVEKIVNSSE